MLNVNNLIPNSTLTKREKWLLTILFPIPGWTILIAAFALYKMILHKRKLANPSIDQLTHS
ncbi:MAG: hypothetical protein EBR94_05585 [Bacteroidetes bacterium]|nr:hypothetical protein [Bacteroidota bacterium]